MGPAALLDSARFIQPAYSLCAEVLCGPRLSPALTVSEDEMATALRILAGAVGSVAGEPRGDNLAAATAAGAMAAVEASS